MVGLDIFALIVLIILVLCSLGIWILLGIYPGKIAYQRNHPQADAIGTAAIYTESVTATHITRKAMVRTEAWMNYLKP